MADRTRYRYVNFIEGRILQAREIDEMQDVSLGVYDSYGVTDPYATVVHDLNATYREGALFNTSAVITPGTAIVTLTRIDVLKPMLVFVRGRWEELHESAVNTAPAETVATTLSSVQTDLFLNWYLKKVTLGAVDDLTHDASLKDLNTQEATAEMGMLVLTVGTTDDSVRAFAADEFVKNMSPISLFKFSHSGSTLLLVPQDNIIPQALATSQTSGLVKTSTNNPVVASTDDVRLSDQRTPLDASVINVKVRTPLQDGVVVNADGTPRYDLTKDIGGIDSAKIIHQVGTQRMSDALENVKSTVVANKADVDAHKTAHLGLANTHPFPIYSEVGATPASHAALGLEAAHGLGATRNTSGFSVTRDKTVPPTAGDPAFTIKDQDGDLAKLTHDGDVFAKMGNGFAASVAGGLVGGPLGLFSNLAKVLGSHTQTRGGGAVTPTNPHGMALSDLGGAALAYVDLQDQNILDAAVAYSDLIGSISVRKETTLGPLVENAWDSIPGETGPGDTFHKNSNVTRYMGWVIFNLGNRVELAFGQGTLRDGENVSVPNGFQITNCVASAGMSDYLDKNDENKPAWAAGVGSMTQVADGSGGYRPNGVYTRHSSSWGEKPLYANVSAVAWRLLTPPSVIIQLDKISGHAGTVVVAKGRNFGATVGQVILTVGGAGAVVSSCTPTQIVFTVPGLGLGAQAVTLNINGVSSINQTSFTVN